MNTIAVDQISKVFLKSSAPDVMKSGSESHIHKMPLIMLQLAMRGKHKKHIPFKTYFNTSFT